MMTADVCSFGIESLQQYDNPVIASFVNMQKVQNRHIICVTVAAASHSAGDTVTYPISTGPLAH